MKEDGREGGRGKISIRGRRTAATLGGKNFERGGCAEGGGKRKKKKQRAEAASDGGTEGSMEGEDLREPRGGGRGVSSCAPASAAVRSSTGVGRGSGRGLVQRLVQRPPGRRALVAKYLAGHARRGGTSEQQRQPTLLANATQRCAGHRRYQVPPAGVPSAEEGPKLGPSNN